MHSANDILSLHRPPTSQIHFGENYLQELSEKASLLPRTIRWHFIGALQTNKCSALAQIPNVSVVSSVDTIKKADALNRGRATLFASSSKDSDQGRAGKEDRRRRPQSLDGEEQKQQQHQHQGNEGEEEEGRRLGVHVQVNTSSEASKSGVEPSFALELCRHVQTNCPHLRLLGLMTIGAIGRSTTNTNNDTVTQDEDSENEDFTLLRQCRDQVADQLGLSSTDDQLELSMGMSDDFETAIRQGADEVRLGSILFGPRPSRKDAKVKD